MTAGRAAPGGRRHAALLVVSAAAASLLVAACDGGRAPEPARFEYPFTEAGPCPSGPRAGPAGARNGLRTREGIRYHVRTPANYRSGHPHPLLVVYAPAGLSGKATERFTGLTPPATSSGYLLAYVDSYPLSVARVRAMADVAPAVAADWCVDPEQIVLTGHSDGGTVVSAVAFLDETRGMAAGIAPSAAGVRGADMASYSCPAPLAVMVMHPAEDRLFPGYGREMAHWWSQCNGCAPEPRPDGPCLEYVGCTEGGRTWYCEVDGGHASWPGLNQGILERMRR